MDSKLINLHSHPSESNEPVKGATPSTAALNQQSLKARWDTSSNSSPDEWRDWIKLLGLELLHESPSVALRACQELAQEHDNLNRELFNVAFISCWTSLHENYQVSVRFDIEPHDPRLISLRFPSERPLRCHLNRHLSWPRGRGQPPAQRVRVCRA